MSQFISQSHVRKKARCEVDILFETSAECDSVASHAPYLQRQARDESCGKIRSTRVTMPMQYSLGSESSEVGLKLGSGGDIDSDSTVSVNWVDGGLEHQDSVGQGECNLLNVFPGSNALESRGTKDCDVSSDSPTFAKSLAKWAVERNITQRSLTPLLWLLRSHDCFSGLPRDARSLLGTPRNTAVAAGIVQLSPGTYCHYGLRKGLEHILGSAECVPDVIPLCFNIDGLPLGKSSKQQLWPVQCCVRGPDLADELQKPFLVGAFVGPSKPDCANDFLKPFVSELKELLQSGISVSGKVAEIKLKSIICDAPARAFVFQIKGHSSYYGCPKCTAEGSFHEKVVFSATVGRPRTDDSFRQQEDMDHHLGVTILTELPIDCITCAPLDPMHLLYLGVMRKLVNLWFSGPLSVRIGPLNRIEISKRSCSLEKHVPQEFARKPRSFDEKDRWKATEFRQLLHYTGPVVLEGSLSAAAYANFLTLHAASSILSTPSLCPEHADYAQTLLEHFVRGFVELYGASNVSYNVHCLLHLAADAKVHGTLESFSAFAFENNLQMIKKLLRRSGCPLHQLYNRLKESDNLQSFSSSCTIDGYELLGSHDAAVTPAGCMNPQYKAVKFHSFTVTPKAANNCCKVGNAIVLVDAIAHSSQDESPCIVGRHFLEVKPLYTQPFDSTRLSIAVVDGLSNVQCWSITDIQNKLVILPYHDKFVVVPLLHTS